MSGTVSGTKDRGAGYSGYTTPPRVYRIWRRVYRGTSAQVSNRTLNRKVIKSQERKGSERGSNGDGGAWQPRLTFRHIFFLCRLQLYFISCPLPEVPYSLSPSWLSSL